MLVLMIFVLIFSLFFTKSYKNGEGNGNTDMLITCHLLMMIKGL